MDMGLDPDTANCPPTSTTNTSAIYNYGFDTCGTRLSQDTDGNFVYENHVGRSALMVNGVYRDLG